METPELLTTFFETLLSPLGAHHVTAKSTKKLAESFAKDLIFAISKGKFLTIKHTSIGLGLYSTTGMKIPLLIFSRSIT